MKNYSLIRIDRFIVLVLIAAFFIFAFVPVLTGKTAPTAPVNEKGLVTGSVMDDAVLFMSKSAFVVPPEAAQWALSAQGRDSVGTAEVRSAKSR
jgi:hypothetical protein